MGKIKLPKLYKYNEQSLIHTEFHWKRWMLLFIVLFLSVSFAAIYPKEQCPANQIIYGEQEIILKSDNEFSKEKLVTLMKRLNIKHCDVVYSQFYIESGGFKSNLFKKQNNIAGMRISTTRPTTATGEERGYASYRNWEDSILDYAFFQASFLRGATKEDYYAYLKNVYAQDEKYVATIKQFIKKNKIKQLFK